MIMSFNISVVLQSLTMFYFVMGLDLKITVRERRNKGSMELLCRNQDFVMHGSNK